MPKGNGALTPFPVPKGWLEQCLGPTALKSRASGWSVSEALACSPKPREFRGVGVPEAKKSQEAGPAEVAGP